MLHHLILDMQHELFKNYHTIFFSFIFKIIFVFLIFRGYKGVETGV